MLAAQLTDALATAGDLLGEFLPASHPALHRIDTLVAKAERQLAAGHLLAIALNNQSSMPIDRTVDSPGARALT